MQQHPELSRLIDDDAPRSVRESSLGHLSECAECRAHLASVDPSRLFSLLALEPIPSGRLERLSEKVADAVRETEPGATVPGFRRGWAAIAASLLLAGVFSAYLWDRDGRTAEPGGTSSGTWVVDQGREPEFELLSSPGTAQVVDLSVGGTRFVMIFDEDLDL